jgi:hypothetical protein
VGIHRDNVEPLQFVRVSRLRTSLGAESSRATVFIIRPSSGQSVFCVQLPFEQNVNAFFTKAYEHRTFFTRLHQFVLMSDAFIVMPGGIGTLLEAMIIWQLLQVGHLQKTPLILVGKMYAELVAWRRQHMLRPDISLANAEDIALPHCVRGSWAFCARATPTGSRRGVGKVFPFPHPTRATPRQLGGPRE